MAHQTERERDYYARRKDHTCPTCSASCMDSRWPYQESVEETKARLTPHGYQEMLTNGLLHVVLHNGRVVASGLNSEDAWAELTNTHA